MLGVNWLTLLWTMVTKLEKIVVEVDPSYRDKTVVLIKLIININLVVNSGFGDVIDGHFSGIGFS